MAKSIAYSSPRTLLNKGTGFLSGYSHSLNPYTGCAFGCSYCYVRQMPVSVFRKEDWGTWVDVKQDAASLLQKELRRAKTKGPVTIFMSSSTDPYQPVEYKEQVTRSLLEVMAADPPDFLLVQTRSPLVTRDIDVLQQLGSRVRVSMTVETDRDEIRKLFSPEAPPIQARLRALRELAEAGIPTQAAVAPILPSGEPFAAALRELVNRVVLDNYELGDGSGGTRTRRLGIEALYQSNGLKQWYGAQALELMQERMKRYFTENELFVSQQGFEP
ncbi:radical SAM family protein [Paenibacillus cellulosilyticus]|uniref:Radical SAM family protein n=1 Tax=Paenibacillus cellulosilyticus TaxID=375489 RepID=A0A2V2YPN4_9BACL|nr:radical SAM protein [Paenibacillus cellulosilyticus]PWV98439.1 radical SAM family protein [Paenibacillus cellulosilyticus]QKS43285.1 radical SAM protein [Paenibacillus cellulosilyticus]